MGGLQRFDLFTNDVPGSFDGFDNGSKDLVDFRSFPFEPYVRELFLQLGTVRDGV